MLEGSVRRSGGRLRVNAQLVDAETGEHVWGERYDRDLVDFFAVQDEITAAVAQSIEPAISVSEQHRAARKPPGNLSAWEAYQCGLWHVSHPSAESHARARELFNRAIAQDPMFAPPYYLLAFLLIRETASYLGRPAAETAKLAMPLVQRAIELDPHDADAQGVATIVDAWSGDWEGALARSEQAIVMNPNSVLAHRARAFCLYNFRRRDEARAELMTCQRLNSRDPQNWLVLLQAAITYYLDANYPEALDAAQRAVRLYPSEPQIHVIIAAVLGQLGRQSESHKSLLRAEALLPPGASLIIPFRPPFKYPEDHEHVLEGLRKAGWGS